MKTFNTSEGRCLQNTHCPNCVTFTERVLRSVDLIDIDDNDNGNGDDDDDDNYENEQLKLQREGPPEGFEENKQNTHNALQAPGQ